MSYIVERKSRFYVVAYDGLADVVTCPTGAELGAPCRQFADEVVQIAVVRHPSGFRSQDRDGDVGGLVPVGIEATRRRVQNANRARFAGWRPSGRTST